MLVSVERAAAQLASSPWPMYQHDPQHSGRSAYAGPSAATLYWSYPLTEQPGGVAIAADGTIYVPTGMMSSDSSGHLVALNPDGTLKWSFALHTTPLMLPNHTTPAIASDGTIYLHANENAIAGRDRLYAINPDGTLEWIYDFNLGLAVLSDFYLSAPAIDSIGTVFVASKDTALYALNPNGTLRWVRAPRSSSRTGSPALLSQGEVLSSDLFDLDNFNADTGATIWTSPHSDSTSRATPSVSGSGKITLLGYRSGYKLVSLTSSGSFDWAATVTSNTGGAPAHSIAGQVFVTDGKVKSFDGAGTEQWSYGFAGFLCEPLLDGAGNLYVRSGFSVTALSPSGALLWSAATPSSGSSAPAPNMAIGADGALYVPVPDSFSSGKALRAYLCNAPAIAAQPESASACDGGSVTFSVTASSGSPTYQWIKDGSLIIGATGPTLSIDPVVASSAGNYWCNLGNACGTTTSASAALTVLPLPGSVGNSQRIELAAAQMIITWQPVAGADGYAVWRSAAPAGPFSTTVGSTIDPDTELSLATSSQPAEAYYVVRAVAGGCAGP